MTAKHIPAALLLLLIGGSILYAVFSHRVNGEKMSPPAVVATKIKTLSPAAGAEVAAVASTPASVREKSGDKPATVLALPLKPVAGADSQKLIADQVSKPPKVIQDPAARLALNFVGADPLAEQYWAAAINDPNLPANERKDLIEDLNEDGLSDPKHPGAQDLPLILSRIQIIEQLGPSAMDEVNAKAFAEAYKDLVNLAQGGTAQ